MSKNKSPGFREVFLDQDLVLFLCWIKIEGSTLSESIYRSFWCHETGNTMTDIGSQEIPPSETPAH